VNVLTLPPVPKGSSRVTSSPQIQNPPIANKYF
jgi:hypothetical protein